MEGDATKRRLTFLNAGEDEWKLDSSPALVDGREDIARLKAARNMGLVRGERQCRTMWRREMCFKSTLGAAVVCMCVFCDQRSVHAGSELSAEEPSAGLPTRAS